MALPLVVAVPVAGLSAAAVSAGAELFAWLQKRRRPPWRIPSDEPGRKTDLWPSPRFYWSVQGLRLLLAGAIIELLYFASQIDTVRTAIYAGFSASLLISRVAEGKDLGDAAAALVQEESPATPEPADVNEPAPEPS
jgi:hypothetical protein